MRSFSVAVGRLRTEIADFEVNSHCCSGAVDKAVDKAASDGVEKLFKNEQEQWRFAYSVSSRPGYTIGWVEADPGSETTIISIQVAGLEADPEEVELEVERRVNWPKADGFTVTVERLLVERRDFEVEAESAAEAIAKALRKKGGDESGWERVSKSLPYAVFVVPSPGFFSEVCVESVYSSKLKWDVEAEGLEALDAGVVNALHEHQEMKWTAAQKSTPDKAPRSRII
jgi:hypothetical protein